jgi:hypothetical protein
MLVERRSTMGFRRFGSLVPCWIVVAALPVAAGVTVGFDVATLNEVLPALSAEEIAVPISGNNSIGVRLEKMQVTGLDPTAGGEGGPGHILTSMRVRVAQLGIDLPVEPRLSLHVVEQESGSLLELRFERVEIPLPLAGSIDVAAFLPPISFPAENLWLLAGAEGTIEIKSELSGIEMGRNVLRFEFDLETVPGE